MQTQTKSLGFSAHAYTDAKQFDAELKTIWRDTWQLAGREHTIPEPGDYLTCTLGKEPIFVIRATDGSLQARHNLCPHRGAKLLDGEGSCPTHKITCPYHAWTFDLEGQLLGVANAKLFPNLERSQFHLLPARVETWGGFVFVNANPTGESLADYLAEMPAFLELYDQDWTTLREVDRWYYDQPINWKFVVENYVEDYHSKARVPAYPCTEQYGIIWVALDEPRCPLPVIAELASAEWHVVAIGPYTWNCDASRMIENLTDIGHFPWVHPGLLGDRDRPEVPDHKVERTGNLLTYSLARPVAPNPQDFQGFADQEEKPVRYSSYELYLPYTLLQRSSWGKAEKLNYFFACQPQSPNQCTAYGLIARTYNLDQPDSVMQAFEEVLFNQDRPIIESQRPEQVPFDLAAELHLKFDAVAVAYRRAMQAEGLAYGPMGVTVD